IEQAARLLIDRPTFDVLLRFYLSVDEARLLKTDEREAQLAVRWLTGDSLDSQEASQLGLRNGAGEDESISLSGMEQVRLVFVALCQLAKVLDQPLILCLDQVDNLDGPQLSALSQFLLGLLNTCANLVVITCGVQDTLMRRMTAKPKDGNGQ